MDFSGYVMSNTQLHNLWHYDMWLGHLLMDLPLRQCSASPISDLPDFPPMDCEEYQKLKHEIRAMWIVASHIFTCKKGDFGWGLFFSEDFDHSGRFFNASKPVILGWLARVPSIESCSTGHRYLRSLWSHGKYSIYLGGPVSLANYDQDGLITCKVMSSELCHNKVGVLKASCCSQENQSAACPTAMPGEQISKKRKVVGYRPHKTAAIVTSYKFCTYCGANLASTEGCKKENMKRHWATKHTVDLCREMDVFKEQDTEPVSAKDFMIHVNKVDHVYYSLLNHHYKVVPASNYFEITDTPLLPLDASDEEKHKAYMEFLAKGQVAFKQYQVLYLKGITIPQKYDDLLKPVEDSGYSVINWLSGPPPNNNFSLNSYALTDDENGALVTDVKNELTNVVLGWMDPKKFLSGDMSGIS
ncbi:Somatic embryogenesis receptor kinase 4 [Frankliniella fusca]|uniref:Somatic embryogenesis receptor kinase 4 n=1 Tax=Frankliniella fusca TaxID=407009 RepID=A0AAE1HAK5_9NEOP|nr:Somatic embryogenesis receptor kinase 4 [Frankliniella fusca]KAK3917864.1 Somatic embryogenesis receptor kinase 4 [Frankliniella fusca]KAK3921427.1 Somatic embryogenesis receptor kinase 4 [Frankliniella fusca]KAK3921634.1 Somatic embryogenesis receptor kinase 4 [Frankliniella fusca]KAK3923352.1 Somatic embryogenesis receptor kinase 4 [Frankliniella fusca]